MVLVWPINERDPKGSKDDMINQAVAPVHRSSRAPQNRGKGRRRIRVGPPKTMWRRSQNLAGNSRKREGIRRWEAVDRTPDRSCTLHCVQPGQAGEILGSKSSASQKGETRGPINRTSVRSPEPMH